MSREDFEVYDAIELDRQAAGEDRRAVAELLFDPAKELADQYGLTLRRCSEVHYQLICRHISRPFLLNVYPGNQRLYWDPKRKGPWLELKRPWTLLDVVQAAIDRQEMPHA